MFVGYEVRLDVGLRGQITGVAPGHYQGREQAQKAKLLSM